MMRVGIAAEGDNMNIMCLGWRCRRLAKRQALENR
jgi:hypothetical protein